MESTLSRTTAIAATEFGSQDVSRNVFTSLLFKVWTVDVFSGLSRRQLLTWSSKCKRVTALDGRKSQGLRRVGAFRVNAHVATSLQPSGSPEQRLTVTRVSLSVGMARCLD